jgi:hypothetical protein
MNAIKSLISLGAALALAGCVSMADYNVAIANDGSFAAFDKQFAVNPLDYPVFALVGDKPKQDPEIAARNQPREWSDDILPSDRWEITRLVNGKYLAYSISYGYRFCKRQVHGWIYDCDLNGRMDGDYYKYLYVNRDGVVQGWQYIRNNKMAPSAKTWFKVSDKGDWSGQPWFKCVDRCDKLVNMK